MIIPEADTLFIEPYSARYSLLKMYHSNNLFTRLDFLVCVLQIPSGRVKCQFPGHYGLIYDIRWSPSGHDILTASSDGTAR